MISDHAGTIGIIVVGEDVAKKAASVLIGMSTPFCIIPEPDDGWRITMKKEIYRTAEKKLVEAGVDDFCVRECLIVG